MLLLVCIRSFITIRCKIKEIWDPEFTKSLNKCRAGEKHLSFCKQWGLFFCLQETYRKSVKSLKWTIGLDYLNLLTENRLKVYLAILSARVI